MAKLELRDGTDGARRKIIARLKSELTHVFLHVTSSNPTLGSTLTPTQVGNVSSDTVARVRQLNFTGSATIFQTINNLEQLDDSKITQFYVLASRPVDKLVYVKPSGANWVVKGYSSLSTINPIANSSYYFDEIKIQALDQV